MLCYKSVWIQTSLTNNQITVSCQAKMRSLYEVTYPSPKLTLIFYFSFVFLQISSMLLFVKQYKQEVLGVGEVALPSEGGALREAATQRTAKEAKDRSNSNKKEALDHGNHGSTNLSTAAAAGSTNGTNDSTKSEYVRVSDSFMSPWIKYQSRPARPRFVRKCFLQDWKFLKPLCIVSVVWYMTFFHFHPLSSSGVLVAKVRLPRTLQLSMLSAQVTMAPCGIPPASNVQSVARDWWTWSTSGPIRSCSAEDTTVRRSGRGARAVMRWDDITSWRHDWYQNKIDSERTELWTDIVES